VATILRAEGTAPGRSSYSTCVAVLPVEFRSANMDKHGLNPINPVDMSFPTPRVANRWLGYLGNSARTRAHVLRQPALVVCALQVIELIRPIVRIGNGPTEFILVAALLACPFYFIGFHSSLSLTHTSTSGPRFAIRFSVQDPAIFCRLRYGEPRSILVGRRPQRPPRHAQRGPFDKSLRLFLGDCRHRNQIV
jgi:hypothetical protein